MDSLVTYVVVYTREVEEKQKSDKKKDRPKQVENFKQLGSAISENGGCEHVTEAEYNTVIIKCNAWERDMGTEKGWTRLTT